MVGLSLSIIILAIYSRSKLFTSIGFISIFAGIIASTLVVSYFYRGQTEEQLLSLTGRIQFWEIVVDKISERPIIGYGFYSGTRVLFNVPGADNSYLTVILGGGAILLIAFVIPIFIAGYQLFTSRPSKLGGNLDKKYVSLWAQVTGMFTILLMRSLTGPSFDAHHIALTFYLMTLIVINSLFRYSRRPKPKVARIQPRSALRLMQPNPPNDSV